MGRDRHRARSARVQRAQQISVVRSLEDTIYTARRYLICVLGRVFILASAFFTFNVLIDPLGLVLIAAIPCMNVDRRISLEAGHRGGDLLGVAEHEADIRLARRQRSDRFTADLASEHCMVAGDRDSDRGRSCLCTSGRTVYLFPVLTFIRIGYGHRAVISVRATWAQSCARSRRRRAANPGRSCGQHRRCSPNPSAREGRDRPAARPTHAPFLARCR